MYSCAVQQSLLSSPDRAEPVSIVLCRVKVVRERMSLVQTGGLVGGMSASHSSIASSKYYSCSLSI